MSFMNSSKVVSFAVAETPEQAYCHTVVVLKTPRFVKIHQCHCIDIHWLSGHSGSCTFCQR